LTTGFARFYGRWTGARFSGGHVSPQSPVGGGVDGGPDVTPPPSASPVGTFFARLVLNNIFLRAIIFGALGVLLVFVSARLQQEPADRTGARLLGELGLAVVIAVLGITAALLFGGWDKLKTYIETQVRQDQLAELARIRRSVDHFGEQTLGTLRDVAERVRRRDQAEAHATTQNVNADALARAGVSRAYATRVDAYRELATLLREGDTATVRIAGVRLASFVRYSTGPWTQLLAAIRERPGDLVIRVLLIDPFCEAAWRLTHPRGDGTNPTVLETELRRQVYLTADRLLAQAAELAREAPGVSLDVRLYQADPLAFTVVTDQAAYVQPYLGGRSQVPVLVYPPGGDGYGTVISRFDEIWATRSRSYGSVVERHELGIAAGVRQSGIRNIYKQAQLADARVAAMIRSADRRVWIQGISLKATFNRELDDAMDTLVGRTDVDVRLLVLDPDCEQAYFKTYSLFQGRFASFAEYRAQGEELHRQTELYHDIQESLRRIRRTIADGAGHFSLRTYRSAPQAFVLIADDRALVEQYHYAPTRPGQDLRDLRLTQLPLIEVGPGPSSVYPVLCDHYDFVFTSLAES
jgi:hypothetical protein